MHGPMNIWGEFGKDLFKTKGLGHIQENIGPVDQNTQLAFATLLLKSYDLENEMKFTPFTFKGDIYK